MLVIRPHAIDLKRTSVAAASEAEWSSLTTYALDARVKVTTSAPHKVYKSTRGNNTNRPPAANLEPVEESATSVTSNTVGTGSKTFTIATGKAFSAGMIVNIAKTSTPKSVNMAAEVTSYTTGTGALVVSVYSSTGAGTHTDWTITAEDEIGFWEEVESTNQYRMFDEYVNTQTVATNEIEVALNISKADYVALFGLEGDTVDLELWNSDESTLVWSNTLNLIYGAVIVAGISDWAEYFFGEYEAREDLTEYLGATGYNMVLVIRITAATGTDAKCGAVIVGRAYDIGYSQFGLKAGMVDFSYRDTDDSGRVSVTQGYWAKRNSMTVYMENEKIDYIYRLLTELRGIPTVWVGNQSNTNYESLVVYGLFKDFDITVSGPSHSWCELEIEGLI